ncbi:Pyruvate/Phosphoenolpyruvate kinase-like domain-containing protein [Vararia minispora EC-137]|uniref:Pyruvate/Phosphoenolpyruvate kinase-like domain-containing protein n=1 Tax=Vararia minispora EC-137 TaxID=1314806 RepID=A0ACB8QIR2_9AGAM|nr:Pyruvate/Phosphoenolpyruvate kinase-like domain-containing protein [Vararia minispora EC-137]
MVGQDAATKLRRTLESTKELVVAPGIYDGFSARIALQVGFDTLYMTGAGTTASRLGHADLGIATQTDMVAHASMIALLDPSVPLIADADTGYGGPIMVARTVELYARGGVAGLHIEDQVQTKRCGHLAGKECVPLEAFATRIRAARAARERIGSDIVIIARTDALQMEGYEKAVERLRNARDAGADVGFLEGMTSKDMAVRAVKDLAPWPLLLNMVEHGSTPTISVDEARTMGFRIIIFPWAAVAPAYVAIREGLERLKKTGIVGAPEYISPQFVFEVCGLNESMAIDAAAGGAAFGGLTIGQ